MYNYATFDESKVEFVEIAPASELPGGERLFVELGDRPIVIFNIAGQFLNIKVENLGFIFDDIYVPKSVRNQKPFIVSYPKSKASACITIIADRIGNKAIGALVNDKMAALDKPLANGDCVEIITDKNRKGPNRDWLKFVKTTRARDKIKAASRATALEQIKRIKNIIPGLPK